MGLKKTNRDRLRTPPKDVARGRKRGNRARKPGTGPRAAKGQCIGLNKVNEVLGDAVADISERAFPKSSEGAIAMRGLINALGRKVAHHQFMHRGDKLITLSGSVVAIVSPSGDGFNVEVIEYQTGYRGDYKKKGKKDHGKIGGDETLKVLARALKNHPGIK